MTAPDFPLHPHQEDRQRKTQPRPGLLDWRLLRLHLVSRHAPAALMVVAACAVALRIIPHLAWLSSKGLQAQLVPLTVEAGAAIAIAATAHSPVGEPERAAGIRLPSLRLITSVLLTGLATGLLLAGSTGTTLVGGNADVTRNFAGFVGLGLLSAVVLGGSFAWVGPMIYMIVAEQAIDGAWTTPWAWPARPPHDLDATLCAATVLTVAAVAIMIFGARETSRD